MAHRFLLKTQGQSGESIKGRRTQGEGEMGGKGTVTVLTTYINNHAFIYICMHISINRKSANIFNLLDS